MSELIRDWESARSCIESLLSQLSVTWHEPKWLVTHELLSGRDRGSLEEVLQSLDEWNQRALTSFEGLNNFLRQNDLPTAAIEFNAAYGVGSEEGVVDVMMMQEFTDDAGELVRNLV